MLLVDNAPTLSNRPSFTEKTGIVSHHLIGSIGDELLMHNSYTYLLQVLQTLVLPLHDGAHSSQRCLLQLLAPVEGVAELQQTHVVLGYVIDEMLGSVELPQSQLVVVLIVQDVQ